VSALLVFGVDYDGTIADTNVMIAKWIKMKVGIEVPPWKCDRTRCVPIIGLEIYEEMSDVVYEKEWTLKAPPVEGALEGLKKLKSLGRVYIVTARPKRRIKWAESWLRHHGVLDQIDGFISAWNKSKRDLCREYSINILLDNDERHLTAIKDEDIVKVLIKNGGPKQLNVPRDLLYVTCWEEFLRIVEKIKSRDC